MAKTDEDYLVYCHRNIINNKIYVGITKDVNKRWGRNGNGYRKLKDKGCFANAIEKYGWDNFEHIILETNVTHKQAKFLEKLYIIELDALAPNGYNLTEGGDGLEGFKHSYETRVKFSKIRLGKPSPRKGVKLSQETKDKISIGNFGKVRSEKFKKQVSERMKGKPLPKEVRDKVSKSRMGMKFSNTHRKNLSKALKRYVEMHPEIMSMKASKAVVQYDLNNNEICEYCSVKEAALWNDFDNRYIGQVCNGKRKKYKNFIWRWKVE